MKTTPIEGDPPISEERVEGGIREVEEVLTKTAETGGIIDMKPVVMRVRRQYKESGDLVIDPEEEMEEIGVQDFHTDPAHVGLRVNHTINLGAFWSLSVQVSLDVPCYREEHAEAMEFVAKTVGERLAIEIETGKERASELRKSRGTGMNLF